MRLYTCFIFLCLSCCFSLQSQDSLVFGKKIQTDRNSIPLNILRSDKSFFVLRYNKSLHDFTIEKRAESDGHQLHLTFLKLEEVCSRWFDYEKLDYVLMEKENAFFFIFEKVTNDEKIIYRISIDSAGHAGKSVALCRLEWNNNIHDVNFYFKSTPDNKLLIIGSIIYLNGIVSKSAALFELSQETPLWLKRLPNEDYSSATGGFETSSDNDLWYIRKKYIAFKDSGTNHTYVRDTLLLYHLPARQASPTAVALQIPKHLNFHDAMLVPYKNGVLFFSCLYSVSRLNSSEKSNGYFYAEYLVNDIPLYSKLVPYDEASAKKLTFYDGSDFKDPGYKPFIIKDHFLDENYLICIMERKETDFYKDIFALKFDIGLGEFKWRHVIPRKIFYFSSRTIYKNMGCYSASYFNHTLNIYFLDHPGNVNKNINTTSFEQTNKLLLVGSGVVSEITINDERISKHLFFPNKHYQLVPLKNSPVKPGLPLLFYITNGTWEKFGSEYFTKNKL